MFPQSNLWFEIAALRPMNPLPQAFAHAVLSMGWPPCSQLVTELLPQETLALRSLCAPALPPHGTRSSLLWLLSLPLCDTVLSILVLSARLKAPEAVDRSTSWAGR